MIKDLPGLLPLHEKSYRLALISYKATFNEATIEEKINWCFNTNFPEETKLDTFYQLLKTYNLTEKEQFILEYYGITDYHDFINLYKKKTNKLTLDEKRLLALNEKVNLKDVFLEMKTIGSGIIDG